MAPGQERQAVGKLRALALFGLCLWMADKAALPARAQLTNETFSEQLVGWKAAWPVAVQEGAAVLDDRRTPHVFLFQTALAGAGSLAVTFDFRSEISAQSTSNALRDSFYASLYEIAEPADFITEHDRFAAAHGLLDLDAAGPFDVQGTVGPAPGRAGWSRFAGTVAVSQSYVAILFELYDLNFVAGDSAVRVDNVSVRPGAAP